jgi:hypothetical protein
MTLRSIFIIIGAIVVILLLFTSSTITGQFCVRDAGCVVGDGDGLRFVKTQAAPATFVPAGSTTSTTSNSK